MGGTDKYNSLKGIKERKGLNTLPHNTAQCLTMPRALVRSSDTSVMMEYASDTFPFAAPPTIRATTNKAKLLAAAQSPYEAATPTCSNVRMDEYVWMSKRADQ